MLLKFITVLIFVIVSALICFGAPGDSTIVGPHFSFGNISTSNLKVRATRPTDTVKFTGTGGLAISSSGKTITLDGSAFATATAFRNYTSIDRQVALVSGTNIKTINGASVLGSGNIATTSGTVTSITFAPPFTGGTITSTGTAGLGSVPFGNISSAARSGLGTAAFTASTAYDPSGSATAVKDTTTKTGILYGNGSAISAASSAQMLTAIGAATASVNGYMTSTYAGKLDGIATGATANAKISGTTLDALTDDTGFVTAKAVQDGHNIPHAAPGTSGNLLQSNGTDWASVAVPTWNQNTTGTAAGLSGTPNISVGTIGANGAITQTVAGNLLNSTTATGYNLLSLKPGGSNSYNYIDLGDGSTYGWQIGKDLDAGTLSGFSNALYFYELTSGSSGSRLALQKGGNVSFKGGTTYLYYCDAGVSAGNMCRGNGCSCVGGAWVATPIQIP